MDSEKILKFIEKVNTSDAVDETKTALVGFAQAAMNDEKKAEALQQFINNFTTEGKLDPEIWTVAADAIDDFYNDYIGRGSDTVLMNGEE